VEKVVEMERRQLSWQRGTRAAQANAMTLAEGTIGTGTVNLISTDHFWVVTISAAIGSCLALQIFSFIVGIVTQPVKECESITRHRDGDLGSEFDVAPGLATNNRPDVSLIETDDPIGDASAVSVVENLLLTYQFADHQQLAVPMPSCSKKTATTGS